MIKKSNGATIYPPDFSGPGETIFIKNGRVIDPVNSVDDMLCVVISGGVIKAIERRISREFGGATVIDAEGKWVVPGLVDMHVHLREPGGEEKETIESGTQAAAAGGFTGVACMPNTDPPLDDASGIEYVVRQRKGCASKVHPIGAITRGLRSETLAPIEEMVRAGAKAVSDDGKAVARAGLLRDALDIAKRLNIPVICHSEDADLSRGGYINEGAGSARLGIRGIPALAEDLCVARDLLLSEATGARVHIAHVSTAGAVRLIGDAKKRGVKVTAETCPHYFTLTDADILDRNDTNKKMNPPLRSAADRDAVIQGLRDGVIDVIASDHAPHRATEKAAGFAAAPFGILGLETSLGLTLTYLAKEVLSPAGIVRKMSVNPAAILNLPGGTLSIGAAADVTVIDPGAAWRVDADCFFSKSRNSPFDTFPLTGCATHVILDGRIVFERAR